MDLSHWDAVTFFSREQISYLLAGIDPNAKPYSKGIESKVELYRSIIGAAIDHALHHAWEHVRALTEPPSFIAPDIFDFGADELPSHEIRNSVADVLRDPANVPILLASDPWYTEQFQRDDIHAWATARGLCKGYRFDGIANDRLPDFTLPQEATSEDRLASETLGALSIGLTRQVGTNSISDNARIAAVTRHSMPGGSREKRGKIRRIWAKGNFVDRDTCAEQECEALEMSFSTARKALRNTPDPEPWPAKELKVSRYLHR